MDNMTRQLGAATVVIDPATGNASVNVPLVRDNEHITDEELRKLMQQEAELVYRMVEGEPS